MDYTSVTEATGTLVTREALSMLYTRYWLGGTFCEKKDVLEIACGSGQGLGYLARRARFVVGGDYSEHLLQIARKHYDGRLSLIRLDAHALPFRERSFSVVILYEALYYLQDPTRFLAECRRLLKDEGIVLICTVNKEWADFNPSPFSTRYFSARELSRLLRQAGFSAEIYAAFQVSKSSTRDRVLSLIKRITVSLHLIPKTMKGKALLKRLVFGRLWPIPPEAAEGMADLCPIVAVSSDAPIVQFKVLFAVARLNECTTGEKMYARQARRESSTGTRG